MKLTTQNDIEIEALVRNVLDSFEEYINIGNRVSPEILVSLEEIENDECKIIYIAPERLDSMEFVNIIRGKT